MPPKTPGNTLPETNMAPENGWLEYFFVSFWVPAYFQGRLLLVSGRVAGLNNPEKIGDDGWLTIPKHNQPVEIIHPAAYPPSVSVDNRTFAWVDQKPRPNLKVGRRVRPYFFSELHIGLQGILELFIYWKWLVNPFKSINLSTCAAKFW